MACARILLVFGCFGTGPAGVRVFRNRTKALFFMGSKGDVKEFFGMRFAWRVLLVFGCFGTGPIRVFRNRTKALFFMGSKGDVKKFFGMRFAWRVLESCWCSGVSEPDQSIVFYRFQR